MKKKVDFHKKFGEPFTAAGDNRLGIENKFTQLCVWPGSLVAGDDPAFTTSRIKDFESFMANKFKGTRVKYIEEVKTLPDKENGITVPKTGGRNDVFFYVHTEDLGKFAVPRLAYGIRWWEDVVENGNHLIYPKEVLDKYLIKEPEGKMPVVKLSGENGNIFNLIGICSRALKRVGQADNAEKMAKECFEAKSYDEALQIMMKYCDVR